jgi:hypothetical protein
MIVVSQRLSLRVALRTLMVDAAVRSRGSNEAAARERR